MFESLLGTTIDGVEITADLLKKAINRRLGMVRKKLEKTKHPDRKLNDNELIERYLKEEDIKKGIKPVVGLLHPKENKALQESQQKKQQLLKFDDVRNMNLNVNSFEGYTEAERLFIESRLAEYANDFNLEKKSDEFLAWRAVICELKIMQLEILILNQNAKESAETQKQIDTLDNQYKKHVESLNGLKKQRDNQKAKPSDGDSGNLTESIKTVDDMAQEAAEEQKRIQEHMSRKLNASK